MAEQSGSREPLVVKDNDTRAARMLENPAKYFAEARKRARRQLAEEERGRGRRGRRKARGRE